MIAPSVTSCPQPAISPSLSLILGPSLSPMLVHLHANFSFVPPLPLCGFSPSFPFPPYPPSHLFFEMRSHSHTNFWVRLFADTCVTLIMRTAKCHPHK